MKINDEVKDVPRLVADKLARRCWSVSRDDLRQEAEVAALHMLKNFDPAKGDLRGYLYRGLARHLTNYMWEQGSPVTYKHRRNELRAAHAAPEEAAAHVAGEVDVQADVSCAVWRTRVAQRVMVLAEQEGEAAGFDPEHVVPVLLGEATPLSVAETHALPLLPLLEAVDQVQRAAQVDPVMIRLKNEISRGRAKRPVRVYRDDYDPQGCEA